jgi:hypothetical protein
MVGLVYALNRYQAAERPMRPLCIPSPRRFRGLKADIEQDRPGDLAHSGQGR